jgi:large subunit ribosomal protein L4
MASLKMVKMDGSDAGALDADDAVFGAPLNEAVVHDVAVALQAAKRQGNAETKTRSDVRGGGAKPYRQKGTGNARHGSIREPQMRGGGSVFGPHKRSYRQKVTTQMRRQAMCALLSDRTRDEALKVLDGLQIEEPKTKLFAEMMSKVSGVPRRTLFITKGVDRNVILSARNIPRLHVRTAEEVNALDVLHAGQVVIAREAVEALEQRLSRTKIKKESA